MANKYKGVMRIREAKRRFIPLALSVSLTTFYANGIKTDYSIVTN